MRLDLFLKKARLLKRREWAHALCEEGMVRVNGTPRKASHEVNPGDELAFPLYNRMLRVRVLAIPQGDVAKTDQWSLVEILEDKRILVDEGPGIDPLAPPSKPPTFH